MAGRTEDRPSPWYRSFYWRIGLSFLVFVVLVLIAQSVMFSYVITRSRFAGRSPNTLAAIVAADVGALLTQNPFVDVRQHLEREYGGSTPIYVIVKGGRVVGNQSNPLADELRRSVEAMLNGTEITGDDGEPARRGPVVTAPIQIAGELRGMVVLPPPPRPGPIALAISRIFTIPGTMLLIVATALAAAVIFEPARRRLQALERAAQQLGAGNLAARAPVRGADEIAHVSAAFNRMATDLAVRDDALRTSDRLRRQMLADVSHELKTPLTSMRGYVETLRMAEPSLDLETRERYFGIIERETLRLDRIVKDLLDLARLENDVSAFEARVFSIGRVFEHVANRHGQEAAAHQIAMTMSVTTAADQVVGDPDRLEQVIENLTANAFRHTPDGGTIQLCAAVDDGAVVLSVEDSGGGIPSEHLPYVFDRFYKVDTARSNGSGSGLGLSIAKAIVERHGGAIDVTSHPGRTIFRIRLPHDPQVEQWEGYSTSTNL